MQNFTFHNPVKVVFGRGSIAELVDLVPRDVRVLMTYGGGSIKRNGVYDEIKAALRGRTLREFGGIEPNPRYETLMRAVALARRERVKFLLAVGGGSVLDGTKFIAAAIPFKGRDPWDILGADAEVAAAVPLGCVITLPATGSEMNGFAVISRDSTQEKLAFASPLVYPRFSVLDPVTTFTLPKRQVTNGIVDAFAHVMEQYATYDADSPLQDRQAEALLVTLMEEGPRTLRSPQSYEARANLVWCATQALNGLIACGVPQDWATHMIGHELTALYGIDHAQSLAVVMPALLKHQRRRKRAKLIRYARRVMHLTGPAGDALILKAIDRTERFFRAVGMKTRLSEYGIPEEAAEIVA
ncbi:MAG TPA: NADH-dependent alcohol dehydrogenase, partial [Planctomycetes bacterium]|nr:NADH-dependent alcohol dehydrogenase [Planctomycetota bacterium]